jgi:hypothetical protein
MQSVINPLRRHPQRRAAVVAQVAVCSTIILGFGALVIDIGSAYTTQTELQVAADAAALAAAAELAAHPDGDPQDAAIAAADQYASLNEVRSQSPAVLGDDVEFGRAQLDPATGKFTFQPGGTNYDSVRVTVRRLGDGGGTSLVQVPFLFGPIFGKDGTQLEAKAAAVLIPRDIAVVIDLSGSMNDDSELRHYKSYQGDEGDWRPGVQVNLRDIWCALDGPGPSRPYVPATEGESEYASDTGPTIGAMSTWGDPVVPETYDPTTDPGLWYIKKGTVCTAAGAQTSLAARGYSADEITCLMNGTGETTTQWTDRTAVVLGMATWKSGRPGGTPGGDGDNRVCNDRPGEFTWVAYPAWRSGGWTWQDYIVNYAASTSNNAMYAANHDFLNRCGLKTFVNYLLEDYPSYSKTNILWQTPEEPLQAVKDAVQAMTDVVVGLDGLDQMSLEIFATTAHHEVNLSDDLQAVPGRLYAMQSAHYDSSTNMGAGLLQALSELSSERARNSSAKVIVLMSDGKPNVNEYGSGVPAGDPGTCEWIKEIAQQAADQNTRIYTISVGGDADADLMSEIATIGGGQHFHAEGSPDEYSDQLDAIFRTLGGKRPVALIE